VSTNIDLNSSESDMIADIMFSASENVHIEKKDKSPRPRFDLVTLVVAGERAIHSAIQFKGCCLEILARLTLLIKNPYAGMDINQGIYSTNLTPQALTFKGHEKPAHKFYDVL
jgi:hypothetical protein